MKKIKDPAPMNGHRPPTPEEIGQQSKCAVQLAMQLDLDSATVLAALARSGLRLQRDRIGISAITKEFIR